MNREKQSPAKARKPLPKSKILINSKTMQLNRGGEGVMSDARCTQATCSMGQTCLCTLTCKC